MRIAIGAAAAGVVLTLAGAAWAEPQVIVKCDGPLPDGMRFTSETGWKPFSNPDTGVTITRDKGHFTLTVTGEGAYSTNTVLPLPLQNPKAFKALRGTGNELFHLEKGEGGQTVLKHTIRGGRDGSHVYNIRETILANCPVVAPDVVVSDPSAPGAGG